MGQFSFTVLPEMPLTLESHTGSVGIADFIALKEAQRSSADYSFDYPTLVDVRSSKLDLNKADLLHMHDYLLRHFEVTTVRKVAFLTLEPLHAAFSYYYTELTRSNPLLPIIQETFMSLDACAAWFGIQGFDGRSLEEMLLVLASQGAINATE